MTQTDELYFAYGSNLLYKQMQKRCPSATFFSKAVKHNYKLSFPIVSIKRNSSGVASIKKDKDSIVEGVIYKLSKEDLLKLDKYEALGIRYNRKRVYVNLNKKRKKLVWTYIAVSNHSIDCQPSKVYMNLIVNGANGAQSLKRIHKFFKTYAARQLKTFSR